MEWVVGNKEIVSEHKNQVLSANGAKSAGEMVTA